ncbi:hypothetical protein [Nostoc sp.]|uniref:hypothetical protein n=1 Tax=Nostoc sp. TaxID=1180 RepID=UPI002FF8E129
MRSSQGQWSQQWGSRSLKIIEGQYPHACFHKSKAVIGLLPLNILSVFSVGVAQPKHRSFLRNTYELSFIRLSGLITPHTIIRNLNTVTQQ